ncbi:hypothetical protein MMC30_005145 [Trapelia coarctata]|nr:hypothetical protein [Trapelia coarctata]
MLCDICESLELSRDNFIIKPNDNTATFEQYHDLGPLQTIRKKSSHCTLCRLIVEAVGGSQPPPGQREKDIRCQLYWQDDGFICTEEEPIARSLRISAEPWPLSFNEFNRLTILADDVPDGQQLFFGRGIMETRIDVKLVKKWMKLCQRWHGEGCQQLSTTLSLEFPSNFRVLDTWARCVVQAPSACRYLALSYIWGAVEVFKLTTKNLDELQAAGGLQKVWQNLPNTIRDAITLTSSLSIRYIWIDSLCIVQDDDRDKMSLIPNMHLIYDRAFMTIIAGTGKDAEAGLPGVRTNSRAHAQTVEEILPGLRLVCLKSLTDALNQSIYESRAWTYQEKCLSRRCLIFINGQVMFQCRSAVWREDVFLEHVDVEDSFEMLVKHSISGRGATGEPFSDYAGSLYEYSSRHLSYDSDILNAFAGISGVLTERMSNERTPELNEVYGLPTYFFDWAILWTPNKTAHRRSGGWPSWSWCGWIGTIAMFLSSLTNASKLEDWLCNHTWIKWIIYDFKGQPLMHLPSNSTYQREKTRFPPTNYPQTSPAPATKVQAMIASSTLNHGTLPPPSSPSLVSDGNGCAPLLHFTTLSTHFHLAPTEFLIGDAEPQFRSFKIRDASRTPCGTIWLSTRWHYTLDKAYEFVILSDAMRTRVVKSKFLPIESESRWDTYHVMMINWLGNGDVAERVAMGAVYREAINKAVEPGTEWKEIWLR